MRFHERGNEESSAQEDSCGVCQLEVEIERKLDPHDTEREKCDELHRARVHMQFVCRLYKLQHEEGR